MAYRRLVIAFASLLTGCFGSYATDEGDSGAGDGSVQGDTDGGTSASGVPLDEQFPPELLQPYAGPPNTDYENTVINYTQLRNKVAAIFADDWVRSGTSQWTANIALFGGVDFVNRFIEQRDISADFLLGIDLMSQDVCAKSATDRTGAFAGLTPATTTAEATIKTGITQLYQRILFRQPTADELTSTYALYTELVGLGVTRLESFSGVCEALLKHPDFLFTLAPSYATTTGAEKDGLMLAKITLDLTGRPPTSAELAALANGKTLVDATEELLSSQAFRDYFFLKMRIRTQSSGTADSDEPARLWTYLATNDAPMQELLVGDYSVDTSFAKVARPAEHGRSGLLTMKGYIQGKPGLPHYNYAARVLSDFMGVQFVVPQSVLEMRANTTPASTVEPGTVCYGCHNTLTPLQYQRTRWDDDGNYLTTDANGAPIDDSDRGVVQGYPWPGVGMEGFSQHAVKKESFIRQTINAHYILLTGRRMRATEDERVIYKQLWDATAASGGKIKELLRIIIQSQAYRGGAP